MFLKAENLQRAGAFKFRGALNAVRSLSPAERRRGVCTYSSGNHGQALALAAASEGARAVVFMPEDAPGLKVEAARAYGAEVRFAGRTSVERRGAAERLVELDGLVMIPPFDDARIIAGQGTVGLEIVEQVEPVDVLLVPVGGGGLIAGTSLAVKDRFRAVEIHGVEPTHANALDRALAAGRPVAVEPGPTIADGLKPLSIGEITFTIAQELVTDSILVSDDELIAAVRFLAESARLVVEPSGAAGVAALLSGRVPLAGRTCVVVLSGGNIDPALLARILAS